MDGCREGVFHSIDIPLTKLGWPDAAGGRCEPPDSQNPGLWWLQVFAGPWMEMNSPPRLSSPNIPPPQQAGVWDPASISSRGGGRCSTDPLGTRSSRRLCVRCRVKSFSSAAARPRHPRSGQVHPVCICCCPSIPFFPKHWILLDIRLDEALIQQTL